ncbi:myb/SANT-like DNA-binding domain-containing protein 3 [Prorops nasuta]|uniref:myb/SANT-like DNA-binding domain-containing protein 3 n=1 Tax=Prorops nasuta TaxID=863751 RepID=UPI0034CF478A
MEKKIFLEILKKYKSVIENKSVNAVSLSDKNISWNAITEEYNNNQLIDIKRDVQQLKKFWQNLKQQTRHTLTVERQSRYLTGGGPEMPEMEIDSDVLDVLPSLMLTAPVTASSNFSDKESQSIKSKVIEAVRNTSTKRLNNVNINDCNEIYLSDDSNEEEGININPKSRIESDLASSNSGSIKKLKLERTLSLKEKEMTLANIKINHEIKLCQIIQEKERTIARLITEKLETENAEAKERFKLAKFISKKEMGDSYE